MNLQELIFLHQYLYPLPNKTYQLQDAMGHIEELIAKEIKAVTKITRDAQRTQDQPDDEIPF